MRATTPSTLLTMVILGGCFELPEPAKDVAVDDTASTGGECPPDSVSGSLGAVVIVDFVVNGRQLGPTPSSLCVFVDGYGARLGLLAGDESGQVTVKSAALGAWGVPDDAVEVEVSWGEIAWSGSSFYTGSVVISEGSGGDSGLGDSGGGSGGAYVGFNGEATNEGDQQLVLNVSWEG
ncbi:MAG: hypothetical protein RIT28_1181 [Pseudomonadota bacterium]|jgi:hypothetical protein